MQLLPPSAGVVFPACALGLNEIRNGLQAYGYGEQEKLQRPDLRIEMLLLNLLSAPSQHLTSENGVIVSPSALLNGDFLLKQVK